MLPRKNIKALKRLPCERSLLEHILTMPPLSIETIICTKRAQGAGVTVACQKVKLKVKLGMANGDRDVICRKENNCTHLAAGLRAHSHEVVTVSGQSCGDKRQLFNDLLVETVLICVRVRLHRVSADC